MKEIRFYQKAAQRYNNEPLTSALAEAIVRSTNKTADRNFLTMCDYPVRAVGIIRKMKSSEEVIVEVIKLVDDTEKVALIFECKVDDDNARKALGQLAGYMRDTECRDGICMSPNIALMYRDSDAQFPDQIGRELNLNIDEDMNSLIAHINSL